MHRLFRPISLLVMLALALAVIPASVQVAHAATNLQLSRSTAAAGDSIAVHGSEFAPNESAVVTVNFQVNNATQQVRQAVRTDNAGAFSATLTVPQGTAPGTYTVSAQDFKQNKASHALTILPLAMVQVGGNPATVTVVAGQSFYTKGSGFGANETVDLTVGFPLYNGGNTLSVHKTARTDRDGAFGEVLFTVPNGAKTGKVTLTATGQSSKKSATANIDVVYRPQLSVNPTDTRPGGQITVNGGGFVPNGKVTIALTIPRQNASTITLSRTVATGPKGGLSAKFNLPISTKTGTYTVTASDTVSGAHVSASVKVSLAPVVTVKPNFTRPGGTVTVDGSGFSSNASVTVTATVPIFGGGSKSLSVTAHTGAKGGFSTHLTIPGHAAPGALQVTATGPNGHASAKLTIGHIGALVSVKPTTARPGSDVSVHGTGFPAGDSVSVSLPLRLTDGSTKNVTATPKANQSGGFTVTIHLPGNVKVGTYTVHATSQSTGRAPTARLTIAVAAHISLDRPFVLPGGSTTVTGRGFGAGVSVTLSASVPLFGGGAKTVSQTVGTNGAGQFSTHFAVPSNAAAGPVTVTAQGPNSRSSAQLTIGRLGAAIAVSNTSAIPGSSVTVSGSGFPSGDTVSVKITIHTSSGTDRTLTAAGHAGSNGKFSAALAIPADATGGTYTVVATSQTTGRAPTARLTVVTLKPSLVVAPTTLAPGARVTASGFGFAAGAHITISFRGRNVGTATANSAGKFTATITIPTSIGTGSYTFAATGSAGRKASAQVQVKRSVSTHFYFASIFTGPGHQEYLAFVNPSTIPAQVTITYELTNGTTKTRTVTVGRQSRFTEDAVADLGPKVSAAAAVSADVPIAAELLKYQGRDGAVIPGSRSPSTIWLFANGNTTGKYREYIAIQNPNASATQVWVRILPTHHKPITLPRTMAPTSRLTIKVNRFVHDAVGVTVTSSAPVVANRTIKIKHGMNSKNGVVKAQRTWYFAAGARNPAAHFWLGIINPSNGGTNVTVRTYGSYGRPLGTLSRRLGAHARVGYLINKLAHTPDASVVVTASGPVVAEQTSYVGGKHNAATDSFGVPSPAKSWAFAAADTSNARGASDYLVLFNPGLVPAPVVVQVMGTSGHVTQRTYVVGPQYHQRIDIGSLAPNQQVGIVATSSVPFTALNRNLFNHGAGSAISAGIAL